jgi:two-component system, cell cycle response regulator
VTTVLAAASAALAALALLLVVLLVTRRGENRDGAVIEALEEFESRFESLLEEVRESIEHQAGKRRSLEELAGSIDLDEVLTRVLDTAAARPGADAALIAVWDAAGVGKPIVATVGLSPEEAERQLVSGPPDGRDARAISISYQYRPSERLGEAEPIQSGVAVPVPGEREPVALLSVFTRARTRSFGEDEIRELEGIARRAGPAIENAKRFREAKRLADLDALTGLHNRRYFHQTLEREVARAHRYDRSLALIILDLDGFKEINDRIGHLAGDAVLAELGERLSEVVRTADVACRVGGEEFAVILPESTLAEANRLYRRLQISLSSPVGEAGELSVSGGIAELMPGEDARTFFERADAALYAAKDAGKGRAVVSPENGGAVHGAA